MTVVVGTPVMCNGYEGNVTEVCTGVLAGMAVVRLDRGSVCVGISELAPVAPPARAEAVDEWGATKSDRDALRRQGICWMD